MPSKSEDKTHGQTDLSRSSGQGPYCKGGKSACFCGNDSHAKDGLRPITHLCPCGFQIKDFTADSIPCLLQTVVVVVVVVVIVRSPIQCDRLLFVDIRNEC